MADLLNKHIKKATSRTKEKLLEGFGKAKATQDETFDSYAVNLSKQIKSCERLYKDLKAYSAALRMLCQAEKTLRDTIRDAYEPEWPERELLTALLDNLDIQTNELERFLCDDLPHVVSNYIGQFADLKKKVDKRGRKLVDYDHAKNCYNSAKMSNKKVKGKEKEITDDENDPRVLKMKAELHQAEIMYKEMNNELLEILPATYDSRITFYVDTLQALFNAHSIHQTESNKLNKQLVSQLDKLGESMDYLRVPRSNPRATTPTEGIADYSRQSTPSPASPPMQAPTSNSTLVSANCVRNPFDEDRDAEDTSENKMYPHLGTPNEGDILKLKKDKDVTNPFDEDTDGEEEAQIVDLGTESITKEIRKVLYKVISTHEYKAVDTDELSFGPGEEIKVLESTTEDQIDEGWQLGEKANGIRGVFPENFTRKVV